MEIRMKSIRLPIPQKPTVQNFSKPKKEKKISFQPWEVLYHLKDFTVSKQLAFLRLPLHPKKRLDLS